MSLPATEVNDRGDLSGDAPRVGGGGGSSISRSQRPFETGPFTFFQLGK